MSTFDEDLFLKGLELIIHKLKVGCSKSLATNQCALIRLKKSISLIVRLPDKITAVIIDHITKDIPVVIQAFFFKFGFAGAPACVPGSTSPTSP
jgi:hypothetical protein